MDDFLDKDEVAAREALDAKILEAAGTTDEDNDDNSGLLNLTFRQKMGIVAAAAAGCLIILGALWLFFNNTATKGYVVDKYWTLTTGAADSTMYLCSGRSPVDVGVLQEQYGYTPDNADYRLTYVLQLQAEDPREHEADIRDTYDVTVTEASWLETEIGTWVMITGNG